MANDKRVTASERRANTAKGNNPFNTVSASKRRATQSVRSGKAVPNASRHEHVLDQTMLADILAHPSKDVSEGELRKEYGYVLADLRSMGLLSISLVVLLVFLATVLPK